MAPRSTGAGSWRPLVTVRPRTLGRLGSRADHALEGHDVPREAAVLMDRLQSVAAERLEHPRG